MRCFGKKDERKSSSPPAPSVKRKQQQNRHHSEPQSSEYWNKVNGIGGSGSGKKVSHLLNYSVWECKLDLSGFGVTMNQGD
jgi:hypothetical protein